MAFTGEYKDFPTIPSNKEIIQYCQSVNHIVDSILMKEWLLLRNLETILQSSGKPEEDETKDST